MNRLMVALGFGTFLLVFPCSELRAEPPEVAMRAADGTLVRSSVSGPNVQWHEDLKTGWAESRRRNVPMVIFITSDHCHYCDAMKRDTWCNESVRSRLSNDFVAIRLDPTRNAATLGRIKIKMYPTTLIGHPKGKVTDHRLGYQSASAIHGLLSQAKVD